MKDQVPDTPSRRAAGYWFIDGLPELVAGIGLIMLAGSLMWLHQIHPSGWPLRVGFAVFALISLGVVSTYHRPITLFLKSRLTFPRTGYVRPPEDWETVSEREPVISLGLAGQRPPDQNVTRFRSSTIGVMICGQALAGLIEKPIGIPIAMTAIAGLLYVMHRESERPYRLASLLPLPLAGLASMYLPLDREQNGWMALLIGGVWLAAQGGWSLCAYIRQNPRYGTEGLLRP